jgi:hypothetical protein
MKRNPYLRVKLKSLAEEARIIRQEERKANKYRDYVLQDRLHYHRVEDVRSEARATLLAYQYLRGMPYAICEKANSTIPDIAAFERMCLKYGKVKVSFDEWAKEKEPKPSLVDWLLGNKNKVA